MIHVENVNDAAVLVDPVDDAIGAATGTMTARQPPQQRLVDAVRIDRLGAEQFFSQHGYGPSRSQELVWTTAAIPRKAILGTAYELATGQRLAAGDFEGGKAGAVRVLGKLGFTIEPLQ